MQFSVYLKGPLTEVAPHRIPRSLALLALHHGIVRQIGQNSVQMIGNTSIRDLKNVLRGTSDRKIPRLNPPAYHTLPYTYPLSYSILRHYQSKSV